MRRYLARRQLELEDRLRYSRHVRRILCHFKRLQHSGTGVADIAGLCAAARLADDPAIEKDIQRQIVESVSRLNLRRIDWSTIARGFTDTHLFKAAILKPYIGPTERGVVYISFEAQWARLLNQQDVHEFTRRYLVVCAPSSSPHNIINYLFPHAYPDSYFTGISNPEDLTTLPRVAATMHVLPIYASQWVNPDLFHPLPRPEREFDLVMVASWGKVKRHHALFRAMRRMPGSIRVLLVGQDQDGRTAATIRELAASYGVERQLTVMSNQPYPDVARHLANARASVVLSRREGSCVVVAESFCADTPAALLNDAVIGSRVFINECTGQLLDARWLARDLMGFLERSNDFRPRTWAEQNISCYRTTALLNDILRQEALRRGDTWTVDLAPLQWSPDPLLVRAADRERLGSERQDIAARFGLRIGPEPAEASPVPHGRA